MRELATVRVSQRLSAPNQCELSFHGPVESEPLSPGASLRVVAGEDEASLFSGQVTVVEHAFQADRDHETIVRAYDPLHRLRKSHRARALVQTTVTDLAEELVGELGLSVQAADSGPLWENLVQHRQSDLELLVVLAERCGLYATVRDDVLHLITLEGDGDAVTVHLGEELFEARVELSGETSCRSVTAEGWNPLRAEAHQATADSPRSGRDIGAQVSPADVGGGDTILLLDESAPDDDHVEKLAQAELDTRSAAEVTLWGLAEGNPKLFPGALVEVTGLRGELDGRYVLTEATHTIDGQHGFATEFRTAPPESLPRPVSSVAALGEVTSVDDPDGHGRVRVSLLAYGDVESDWLGVVVPGAGSERGIVALPDVGDRVLVVFPHEDPAAGIVIGGLYGDGGPPDPGVEGGAVKRFTLQTAGGQKIVLDDQEGVLRLTDETGSSVELSPDQVVLHAATDLKIEAPGKAIVIRAKSVDFEQA
jgi:phage protein D/phage baseplate assembly protein gpV